jgi:dipeptidyl aminopeptidase/acylaminoacyl peptidase
VVSYTRLAKDGLLLVDIPTSTPVELPLELVQISGCAMRRVSSTKFVVLGSGLTTPSALYMVDINTHSKKTLLKSSNHIQFPSSTYSIAQHLTFPRTQGQDPKGISHAIFFPPHNPSFSPLPGTRPPVIVSIHGGPTNQGNLGINLQTQYWTSRGYAYVYVNYGGSTGYGREYRDELIDSWGVIDINDAASCLYYLATAGLVDKSKAGIEGGSAGGYTVLNSLVQYPNLWAAGNSLFGISDLMGFEATTHKYESHYLFNLIPDNGPEEREKVLRERSPYYHVNKITSPLLLLQGSEDKVVPLQQAVDMERIMKEKGKDVKITIFEGAGHGFGKAEHVKKTLEEEEALWKRTLL